MEQKDMYTLRELFEELGISIAELGRRSGISEITVAKIRDGKSARRSTVVNLLRTLSDIHGVKLSISNVSGIIINDKLARTQLHTTEKAEKATALPEVRQAKVLAEQARKRPYSRKQENTGLPPGCILASKFAESHGVARPTFIGHMMEGLGAGLIGYSTDTIPQRDQVAYSERPKPGRAKEKEKYLTQNQQRAALEFWKRHDVSFAECERPDCWCHTALKETE